LGRLDEDDLAAAVGDAARRTLCPTHVTPLRHDDGYDAGVLVGRIKRRQRRGFLHRAPRHGFVLIRAPNDDVRAARLFRVEPEVVGTGVLERELVVLRRAPADQNR